MKTQATSLQTSVPVKNADRAEELISKERMQKKENLEKIANEVENPDKNREFKGTETDRLASVKKYIAENIQWKNMRFHRHEENGRIYVDIIDRETGELIKTIPETDFVKVAGQLKHNSGITIDING